MTAAVELATRDTTQDTTVWDRHYKCNTGVNTYHWTCSPIYPTPKHSAGKVTGVHRYR